jgi:hypothetical protein
VRLARLVERHLHRSQDVLRALSRGEVGGDERESRRTVDKQEFGAFERRERRLQRSTFAENLLDLEVGAADPLARRQADERGAKRDDRPVVEHEPGVVVRRRSGLRSRLGNLGDERVGR